MMLMFQRGAPAPQCESLRCSQRSLANADGGRPSSPLTCAYAKLNVEVNVAFCSNSAWKRDPLASSRPSPDFHAALVPSPNDATFIWIPDWPPAAKDAVDDGARGVVGELSEQAKSPPTSNSEAPMARGRCMRGSRSEIFRGVLEHSGDGGWPR